MANVTSGTVARYTSTHTQSQEEKFTASTQTCPQPPLPPLLDQVRQSLRLLHYSVHTESQSVAYITDYLKFHTACSGAWRHPLELGAQDIRDYLNHLAADRRVSSSTQNVALSALLFFYRRVLHVELDYVEHIEFATHLLESGKDVATTMIYTHVLNKGAMAVRSSLDA